LNQLSQHFSSLSAVVEEHMLQKISENNIKGSPFISTILLDMEMYQYNERHVWYWNQTQLDICDFQQFVDFLIRATSIDTSLHIIILSFPDKIKPDRLHNFAIHILFIFLSLPK